MSNPKKLAQSFQTTHWLIGKFVEGMTHEESMARPSFRANTFNWVLGHIVVGRHRVLKLLDEAAVLEERELAVYETGSAPQAEGATAVSLERLLTALDETQKRIEHGLEAAGPEALAAVYDEKRQQTVGERIAGLHWHETYHTGQLEIVRQVSGERPPFP